MNNSRENKIQKWIKNRIENNEINNCVFYITSPQYTECVCKENYITNIIEILEKNNIKYDYCDTVSGSWNLNNEWIQTEKIECIIEYCGVYPINWDINDVVVLENLHNEGKIIIRVYLIDKDGNYIPNH